MSESSAQVIKGGVDSQSALLQNIRQLSGVMEAAQSAGHEDLAGGVSGVRSDLMNIAGMSSSYDPRPTNDVKRDFFEQGEGRMQALIQDAGKIKSEDGLGSAIQARLGGVSASLTSSGYVKAPEMGKEANVEKAHSMASGVVGKLAAALSGQQSPQAGEKSATRWQDVAQRPQGNGHSR